MVGVAASGRPFVLYTEPDKEMFFAEHLRDFVDRASGRDGGVVLAARSESSFASFPPVQRYDRHSLPRSKPKTLRSFSSR